MTNEGYAEYLRSPEWQRVRKAALERAGHRCALCDYDRRLDAHHRTYERIGAELPEDVIVLCRICHKRHHGVLDAPKASSRPLDPGGLSKALMAQARAREKVDREKREGAA